MKRIVITNIGIFLQELLYKKLQELRKDICDELDVPPHTVASTKSLIDITKMRYACHLSAVAFSYWFRTL